MSDRERETVRPSAAQVQGYADELEAYLVQLEAHAQSQLAHIRGIRSGLQNRMREVKP